MIVSKKSEKWNMSLVNFGWIWQLSNELNKTWKSYGLQDPQSKGAHILSQTEADMNDGNLGPGRAGPGDLSGIDFHPKTVPKETEGRCLSLAT